MAQVFERDGDTPLQPGDVDGMEEWMGELDAPTSTDWDLAVENPPHEGYTGYLPHPELAVTRTPTGAKELANDLIKTVPQDMIGVRNDFHADKPGTKDAV
jgi:hypothetical protein